MKYTETELKEILQKHIKWLYNAGGDEGATLTRADLSGANLNNANLAYANLSGASLVGANLTRANLTGATLTRANLNNANLTYANLTDANLTRANLTGANLNNTKGLVKIMGVEPGNYYWKKCECQIINEQKVLVNNGYIFKLGLNKLRTGEVFAEDPRVLCSYPGFHFASKSWCELNYSDRPYLCKIRIPEEAKINEPWATDGKASADMIEIIDVLENGKNVTKQFRKA